MSTKLQQSFLNDVAGIGAKFEAERSKTQFNIFRIIRAGHEEVGLHSRFLFELLNPSGTHGMGDVFLRLFAKIPDFPTLDFSQVQVLREHANIDLLIQDHSQSVVIENKIYAIDQDKQLERYFEYTKNSFRQPALFYLTLNGTAPSLHSIGNLSVEPRQISYKTDIKKWIESCIKVEKVTQFPALRETLIQYHALIDQLTGNSMNDAQNAEIVAFVAQGDNARQAALIFNSWNHIRYEAEQGFWLTLISLAKQSYSTNDEEIQADAVSDAVYEGGGSEYGIGIVMGHLDGNTVEVRVDRNRGIHYGIPYPTNEPAIRNQMREAVQSLGATPSPDWAGWKLAKAGINFQQFQSNEVAQDLVNPEKRQRIVGELWQEIQAFISDASSKFQHIFGKAYTHATRGAAAQS